MKNFFLFIAAAALIICSAFIIGSKLYEKAYTEGYNHGYRSMRVTHVEKQGNDYMVFIRDEQDDLYIHACSK